MKHPEHALHVAVAQYLGWVLRPPIFWTSIDHGAGRMTAISAALRKARGVKPGLPDILILAPGPNVLGIELKAQGGGYQSPAQREVEAAFKDCKAWYVLCRSVEEVGKALDFIKIPRGKAA